MTFKYENRLKKVKGKHFVKLMCPLNEIVEYPVFVRFAINMAYPRQPFGIIDVFAEDTTLDPQEILDGLHEGMVQMGYEEDSFEKAMVSYLTTVYSENN